MKYKLPISDTTAAQKAQVWNRGARHLVRVLAVAVLPIAAMFHFVRAFTKTWKDLKNNMSYEISASWNGFTEDWNLGSYIATEKDFSKTNDDEDVL